MERIGFFYFKGILKPQTVGIKIVIAHVRNVFDIETTENSIN